MRIWLAPSAFSPHRGGVEELSAKLAQHLILRGHEVTIVTNRHPRVLAAREEVEATHVRRIAFETPSRQPWALARYLMSIGPTRTSLGDMGPLPDIVHVICASSQLRAIGRWSAARGVPIVITSQGETHMDADHAYQRSPWMRWVLRRESSTASGLTACSAWTAERAAEIAPAFASAVVIHNGVDPQDWQVGDRPREPVIASWGRHVLQKGFDLLIDAFTQLRREVPEARLRIAGHGPETGGLTGRAGPGVEFIGPVDRQGVRDLLSAARIVAVPSRIEPFGIVALEALAAGRGLVYSIHGGLGEAAGSCGRAVDPYDAESFARALQAELVDPTAAAAGRARAEELSWSAITPVYERLYREVARKPVVDRG